jgi:adenylosuccinate synthase
VIRVADLADDATLALRVDRALVHHNALRAGWARAGGPRRADRAAEGHRAEDPALCRAGLEVLTSAAPRGQAHPVRRGAGRASGHRFRHLSVRDLLERHRGAGGDRRGPRPRAIDYVLGIVKAYTTRVGEGPFPTELDDADGQRLGERGHEFGTTTGRKRRCGWFDAALVRQTCVTSGVNGIALTKLDVLDGFETLKICTGYDARRRAARLPAHGGGRSRRAAYRSTRRCRAGRPPPRARAAGRTFPPRRSSMCAGSRN